jgi:murein L,D-transpeptidase YcbB/YkuD
MRSGWRCFAASALLWTVAIAGVSPAFAQPPAPSFDAERARQAIALLADAPSHGLEASDYGLPDLARWVERAGGASDAALDQALAAALLRYLRDLHDGRVRPRALDHHYAPAAPEGAAGFDAESTLRAAIALQDLASAVRAATPALPQYGRLREALARYRALAAQPAWQWPLAPLPRGAAIEPGQAWAGVPMLVARLQALGDLEPSFGALGTTRHDAALADAVKAFQLRHGLQADGAIGRATWAALEVTPAERVRQIELALERLRWTPLMRGARMVVINVPEFVLRAYEVQGERIVVRQTMKVIVGQALDTRTPLIDEAMRRIEFQPYWNVPASIARKELVPRLRREPAYWAREGFEFVAPGGAVDAVLAADKLAAVLDGRLRIRQRPGPRNALGSVKFVFPNRESIYLHDTPSSTLFERARRDFSHGCIRVEQPLALARFALEGRPGWDEARIRQAMTHGAPPSSVGLARPLPVLIAYGTALVKDGRVHFFEDLYGHDRVLDAALRQRLPLAWP